VSETDQHVSTEASAWKRFWERGGWWRALILVVGYFVLYQGAGLALAPIAPSIDDTESAGYVLF